MALAKCPACQAEFDAPSDMAGALVACPKCRGEVKAPSPDPNMVTASLSANKPSERPARRPTVASAIGAVAFPQQPPGDADHAGGHSSGDSEPSVEQFGQYELISKMATSDVAVTYRARRVAQSKIVVLKALLPGATVSREEISCITERARGARKLDHPNIAKVLEVSKAEDTDFIASEFVEGKPLSKLVEEGTMSVGEAVEFTGSIGEALEHAHREGVVHGNLKLSNVIVDNHGKPKLTDFGMAREFWRIPSQQLKAAPVERIPLPHHMAPEQMRGSEATVHTDVYGLGAILYQMLAKRPPYGGRTLAEVVLEIDSGRLQPPSASNLRVPVSVDGIVMKCLAREPQDRFGSVGEVAAEMDHFLRGQKVKAHAPGPVTRLIRSLQSHSRAVVLVLAAAGLSAGAAYFAARSGRIAQISGVDVHASAQIDDALQLGEDGLWVAAASMLEDIESDESLSAATRSRSAACLGGAHIRGGKYEDAAASFRRAIALRPGSAELHYYLGVSLWHAGGDATEVAREIGTSLELDEERSKSARYQYDYARACERAGLNDEARRAFESVKGLDPKYQVDLVEAHLARLLPRE